MEIRARGGLAVVRWGRRLGRIAEMALREMLNSVTDTNE